MSILGQLERLGRRCRRWRPLPGEGVELEETLNGTRVHVSRPGAVAGARAYTGPWAGRIAGAESVTVGGGEAADMVRFGRYREVVSGGLSVSGITTSGYVWVEARLVDLSVGRYPWVAVSAGFSASFPEDAYRLPSGGVTYEQSGLDMVEDVTHRYVVVIGYARVLHGVVASWQQMHFGEMSFGLGRQVLLYDESVLQQVWYLRRDSTGAVGQYGASVPTGSAAPVYFDPVGEVLVVGGSTAYEQVGRIHTDGDGRLLGLYQILR